MIKPSVAARASSSDDETSSSLLGPNAFVWAVWGAFSSYAWVFSNNFTPLRDRYFLEKIIGLGVDDGVVLNTVRGPAIAQPCSDPCLTRHSAHLAKPLRSL